MRTRSPPTSTAPRTSPRASPPVWSSRGHDVRVDGPRGQPQARHVVEEHDGAVVHRVTGCSAGAGIRTTGCASPCRGPVRRTRAKILDEFKPDVVHIQSHIIVGRGLARRGAQTRHPRRRHEPLHAREHDRAHPAAQVPAEDGHPARLEGRVEARSARATRSRRRAARPRDFLEKPKPSSPACTRSPAASRRSDYTPDFEQRTENRILFVGRVTGEKQIDVLLRAVAKLLTAALDAQARDRRRRRPAAATSSSSPASSASATASPSPGTSPTRSCARPHRATVFAMPSIAELQSIATMEAMASALPVVAANAMALPHLVHHGENGYLFEPGERRRPGGEADARCSRASDEERAQDEARTG